MADGQVRRQFNTGRIEERRENRIETLCLKSKDYLDIEAHNFCYLCCLSVLVGHRNEVALVCWYIYKWGLWETCTYQNGKSRALVEVRD